MLISMQELEINYISAQKRAHQQANDAEEYKNDSYSTTSGTTTISDVTDPVSLLNKAYNTIKNPDSRMQHLIEITKHDTDIVDNASNANNANREDTQQILNEIMFIRDEMENNNNLKEIQSLQNKNTAKIDEYINKFEKYLHEKDIAGMTHTHTSARYYFKNNNLIKDKINELNRDN